MPVLLKALLASALLLAPTSVETAVITPAPVAAPAIEIPVDLIARAKFPKVDPEMIDALSAINRMVNRSIQGMGDQEHYGLPEMWVMFPADGKGDCEDYALTKLGILTNGGGLAYWDYKIVAVRGWDHGRNFGHAILAVRLPDKSVMYLDNRFGEPMTRKELVAAGYEFFDWRA